MPIEDTLEQLRFDRQFMANVTAWERLPARPARYADFPPGLDPRLIAALRSRGTAPLFTHQAAAVEAALAGCIEGDGRGWRLVSMAVGAPPQPP